MARGLSGWMASIALVLGLFVCAAWAESFRVQSIPHGEIRTGEGGYVRVSAIGLSPFGSAEASSAREMARQNAVSLAQRRLLAAILEMQVVSVKVTVRERLASRPQARERLRGLIAKARVVGQELADGSVEVTLELPFAGSNGLGEFLAGLAQ